MGLSAMIGIGGVGSGIAAGDYVLDRLAEPQRRAQEQINAQIAADRADRERTERNRLAQEQATAQRIALARQHAQFAALRRAVGARSTILTTPLGAVGEPTVQRQTALGS
ncbi:MAG TPA: hypothetical protein VNK91_01900 [Burkholderiaceae bacterium]|nr:hypothetical protein [Burkholderiaceae bacterium]